MLRILIIATAILISVVNVSAQTVGSKRHIVRRAGIVRVGPSTTYLKEGFSLEEVLRLLGEPAAVSARHDGDEFITTYEFPRGQNRILIAEFVNGALVRSRTENRVQVALGDR
jgi:hypothetical protein